ncbi:MAG TPA: hypothetical protein VN066_09105 [Rhodocyclaceae bacterium]|nr:hypothetical protein [Rhodocyclaceae bacterium]
MATRKIELSEAFNRIKQLNNEQVLMDVVMAGGVIGTCISKLPGAIRGALTKDLDECLDSVCGNVDALGKLSLVVALNTSDDPLYLQDLVAAIETHLSLP